MFIRDLAHNYTSQTSEELKIIDSPEFQRLRNISQNALASYVYPSLKIDRFTHSLGVAHVAGMFIENAIQNTLEDDQALVEDFINAFSKEVSDIWVEDGVKNKFRSQVNEPVGEDFLIQSFRMAGLLHDIGHLPYSHEGENAVEKFLERILAHEFSHFTELDKKYHEYCTLKIIEEMGEETINPAYKSIVLAILNPPPPQSEQGFPTINALHYLVSSDVDVDRSDYILRDGTHAGRDFGRYDLDRLVHSMRIYKDHDGRFHILPTNSAIGAIERFLSERYFLHKWVYYHRYVKLSDIAISLGISLMILLKDTFLEEWNDSENPAKDFMMNFEGNFHYDSIIEKGHDDVWLLNGLREVHAHFPGEKASRNFELQALKKLLSIVLSRKKVGFALWKDNVEYYEFNELVYSKLLKFKEFEKYDPDLEHVKDIFLNGLALASVEPSKLLEVQDKITSESQQEYSGQVIITILPRFKAYKYNRDEDESGYSILVKQKIDENHRWVPIPLSYASAFVKSLQTTRIRDLHLYIYFLHREDVDSPDEDERQSIKESVATTLASICIEDELLLEHLVTFAKELNQDISAAT